MKMNEIVRRNLANCFVGTDPTQKLLIEKNKIIKPKEAVKKKFGYQITAAASQQIITTKVPKPTIVKIQENSSHSMMH